MNTPATNTPATDRAGPAPGVSSRSAEQVSALLRWFTSLQARGIAVVLRSTGAPGVRTVQLAPPERLTARDRRALGRFLVRHRRAVLHAAELATLPPPEERARLRFPPGLAVESALGERGTVERVEGRTVYVRLQAGPLRRLDYTDLIRREQGGGKAPNQTT